MVIRKAVVKAAARQDGGTVELELVRKADGWTYEIGEVAGGRLALTWRASSPEKASLKLRALYEGPVWKFTVVD